MTRKNIIRMAQKVWGTPNWNEPQIERLERFAKLVAAAERRACIRVCEKQWSDPLNEACPSAIEKYWPDQVLYRCVVAIRARSET
jgi:hypothetical protein